MCGSSFDMGPPSPFDMGPPSTFDMGPPSTFEMGPGAEDMSLGAPDAAAAPDSGSDDGGCSAAGSASGAVWLAALGVFAIRRRRR